jgi:hypothetical protein
MPSQRSQSEARPSPRAWLHELTALFPQSGLARGEFSLCEGDAVPEPYHTLLVHRHHMTVTLERRHGATLELRVLETRCEGDRYARHLFLTADGAGPAVLAGLMRIRLEHCRGEVERAILEQHRPLGRILIEHRVLRHIETVAFLRARFDAGAAADYGWPGQVETFGRLALIFCDGKPAVELLEVVAAENAG